MKVRINNVLFGFSIALMLLLCVTAVLSYAEYGRGSDMLCLSSSFYISQSGIWAR